jgi:hypothetical protein
VYTDNVIFCLLAEGERERRRRGKGERKMPVI